MARDTTEDKPLKLYTCHFILDKDSEEKDYRYSYVYANDPEEAVKSYIKSLGGCHGRNVVFSKEAPVVWFPMEAAVPDRLKDSRLFMFDLYIKSDQQIAVMTTDNEANHASN